MTGSTESGAIINRGPELLSVADSIESAYPSAADFLRGVARELEDAHEFSKMAERQSRTWEARFDDARDRVLVEVTTWAARKRDGAIRPPITIRQSDEQVWRDGYYAAMNGVSQHFNMERHAAERES